MIHEICRCPHCDEACGLDDLTLGATSQPSESDRALAEQAVEVSVQEFLLACSRRTSARLLRTLQQTREALRDDRLPSVLDEQLADLDPVRRRKLESALRGLLREQHRALLRVIEEVAGTAPAVAESPHRENDTGSRFPAGSRVR